MGNLSNDDEILIKKAREVITTNYVKGFHTVGAALRCKSGEIYVGINTEVNQGCCAEVIAISSALTKGNKALECIVAVDMDGRIVNPCGKCRQFIFDCLSSCDVLIDKNGQANRVNITKLLPYAFDQKKINLRRMKEQIKNRKE